jgi:hypothetical protein
MSDGLFSVDWSIQARIDYASIQQRCMGRPASDRVSSALRVAFERLTRDARAVGEPLYHLRKMGMTVMTLIVPPLHITYGVHDGANTVVVQRIIRV